MKKHFMVFITVMIAIILNGCATTQETKFVDSSIGTWEYIIAGTPVGDLNGVFVIAKEGENYTGSLDGAYLSSPLENITVKDSNLNCTLYYSGTPLQMTGTFEDNSFTGEFSSSYGSFPMTAQKMQ